MEHTGSRMPPFVRTPANFDRPVILNNVASQNAKLVTGLPSLAVVERLSQEAPAGNVSWMDGGTFEYSFQTFNNRRKQKPTNVVENGG
jgi:hypothetical protein